MTEYGIDDSEQEIFKRLLSKYNGVLISQEQMMIILMDKEVCNFTLKEADKARKAVAKKNPQALAETEERLYTKGAECGRSKAFLDYLWNVQIEMSKSYAFALCHSHEYSTECLQELNMYYFYPKVYWNTAVITTQSQVADERENSAMSINYGKIAQSIYKARSNESGLSFAPNEENDSILFGLGAISGVNPQIAQQITANRPYTSFKDFYTKNTYQGTLVTKSKFIQLIKAGCFDEFNPDRVAIMREYFELSANSINSLTTANMGQIKAVGIYIPKAIIAPYNFKKYVTSKQFLYGKHPNFKSKNIYWLDNRALKYFNENCRDCLVEGTDYWQEDDRTVVVDKSLEKLLKPSLDNLKSYINQPEFLDKFNEATIDKNMAESVGSYDVNRWSLETCSFYNNNHEYSHVDANKYNITPYEELPEEPEFVVQSWGKRKWRQYSLSQILGVVLDKNDNHHMITILDFHNNVVNVKFDSNFYALMKAQLSETDENGKKTVVDKSWLSRGQGLILTGYRFGENDFKLKNYSSSIFPYKIIKVDSINEDGTLEITTERYGQENQDY